jgi:hypothetical protein
MGLGLIKANLSNWTTMYSLDHISSYKYIFDAIQVRLKTRHHNFDDGKSVMMTEYLKIEIALECKGKKMDEPYSSGKNRKTNL